ncbi:oxamate carbamoyltransferase subunit AllH family protein [Oceanicola sp. S124]|uniref:oxamate carbamoyltransferase subunit AllH family protein n=1 Tax=Oceanicola sp. S124 TaxID=1042378 RepID=UPI000255812A|nr:DUF2877 domain-containing protein [Oceanicola sp. S124]
MRGALVRGGALALQRLHGLSGPVRLLASFDNHAYLEITPPLGAPQVLILARAGQPRGALDLQPALWRDWQALCPGPGRLEAGLLSFPGLELDGRQAEAWPTALPEGAPPLRALRPAALAQRQRSALLEAVLTGAPLPDGCADLAEGLAGRDGTALCRGALALAGLGPGLTPAGDDFLCGVLIAARGQSGTCQALLRAAQTATHAISRAFLQAAAQGHGSAAWRALLTGSEAELPALVVAVAAPGASSGGDVLAGYLWARALPAPRAVPESASRRYGATRDRNPSSAGSPGVT